MDKKFSDLVKDSISKNELKKTYGGTGQGQAECAHACDSSACSSRTGGAAPFCTAGDGICRYHVN